MLSRWIYVLIGNNDTGKTTFQKRLICHLTGLDYKRLDRNISFEVTHKYAPKKLNKLFLMSRSFQESKGEYQTVSRYFEEYFKADDICILSSHAQVSSMSEIEEMIYEGRKRKYNIGGVFFSNADSEETEKIAQFSWDERLYLKNPWIEKDSEWKKQIDCLAWEFSEMLIRRAILQ